MQKPPEAGKAGASRGWEGRSLRGWEGRSLQRLGRQEPPEAGKGDAESSLEPQKPHSPSYTLFWA